MEFKLFALLFLCFLAVNDVEASRAEIRAACSQLQQAVNVMLIPYMPNIYDTSTWMPHLDHYMGSMCSRAEHLQTTWSESGHICTLNSAAVAKARFLMNITEMLCSDEVREELRGFSTNECFTDDDKRYSLAMETGTCIENFMSTRYVAMHISPEFYCQILYNSFGGCVTDATALACGPEVARFVLPMWKVQESNDCYRFADQI